MQFGINFKLLRFSLKGIIALRTWKKIHSFLDSIGAHLVSPASMEKIKNYPKIMCKKQHKIAKKAKT